MWCGKCQSDVAAEVSPDNQRVFCAACGTLLSTIDAPPPRPATERASDRTKDARELLQRWSSGTVIDPFGPTIQPSNSKPAIEPVRAETAKPAPSEAIAEQPPKLAQLTSPPEPVAPAAELPRTNAEVVHAPPPAFAQPIGATTAELPQNIVDQLVTTWSKPIVSTSDAAPIAVPSAASPFADSTAPSASVSLNSTPPTLAVPKSHFRRIDAAHPAVHFAGAKKNSETTTPSQSGPFASAPQPPEVKRTRAWFPAWDPAVWRSEPNSSGSWSAMAGQFLAYAGVLGMTAGACMVVWSYFGGPATYAPTGWLLATAGQMLLFFGVVTLVSGGLEQTTEQVNKRIEQLGDHIIRIEQAAREMNLRSSSVPAAHFGNDPDAPLTQRAMASGNERSVVEE